VADSTYNFMIRCQTDDPDADVYLRETAQALADALEYGPDSTKTYLVEAFASGRPAGRFARGRLGERTPRETPD